MPCWKQKRPRSGKNIYLPYNLDFPPKVLISLKSDHMKKRYVWSCKWKDQRCYLVENRKFWSKNWHVKPKIFFAKYNKCYFKLIEILVIKILVIKILVIKILVIKILVKTKKMVKILVTKRNYQVRAKSGQKSKFWSTIELFYKTRNFGEKSKSWSEFEILVNNQNFGEKSKSWSKFEILVNNQNFGQT